MSCLGNFLAGVCQEGSVVEGADSKLVSFVRFLQSKVCPSFDERSGFW